MWKPSSPVYLKTLPHLHSNTDHFQTLPQHRRYLLFTITTSRLSVQISNSQRLGPTTSPTLSILREQRETRKHVPFSKGFCRSSQPQELITEKIRLERCRVCLYSTGLVTLLACPCRQDAVAVLFWCGSSPPEDFGRKHINQERLRFSMSVNFVDTF